MRCASNIADSSDAEDKAVRITALRRAVERLQSIPLGMEAGNDFAPPARSLACGLPGPGFPSGVLNEFVAPGGRAAAFGFLFTLAAAALEQKRGSALFIAARRALDSGIPCGHGLTGLGVGVGRLLLVDARNDKEALWAIEEALRAQARPVMVAGVIEKGLDLTQSRRLNLAAARHAIPFALLRGTKTSATSAAATRWRVAPAPAARDRFGAFATQRWCVALERCRNGRTGEWMIEWDPETRRFQCVAEKTADRAPPALDLSA